LSEQPIPTLDFAAIFATKAFDEDDLAHNRRGVLSAKQLAWCEANPRFVDRDDGDETLETIVGRVAIEGRYVAGRMGETIFPKLVLREREFSMQPALRSALVRDAPFRAYAAHGWIWSIEPIAEDDLKATPTGVGPYRSPAARTDNAAIARALSEALSTELQFSDGDLEANRGGEFSPAQRAKGRRMLLAAIARVVIAATMLFGVLWMLIVGAPFPVLLTIVVLGVLAASLISSVGLVVDALARVIGDHPFRAIARLDADPMNADNLVFESKARPLKIKRGAIAISEAPASVLRKWRFEVHFLPWTRNVITIRPIPPSKKKKKKKSRTEEG
jgi:hypothetical protein